MAAIIFFHKEKNLLAQKILSRQDDLHISWAKNSSSGVMKKQSRM